MDQHPPQLIGDCLIYIFAFLSEEDLMSAASVCKEWYAAVETPWLWRRMCLQRWSFCNLSALGSDDPDPSWKRYYLRRSHLEAKMTEGRSGGYACRVVGLVYLRANSSQLPQLSHSGAAVCSAATDGTVRVWNVRNGELLWCSPVQSPLAGILADEKQEVVITVDCTGLIKTWQAQTGQEVASYPTHFSHCSLVQFNINNDWFLAVGTGGGSVCTLADVTLTQKSTVMVCDSRRADILLVSPDRKWLVAGTTEAGDLSLKVISTSSLTPSDDEGTLCQSVPVVGCSAAVFIPTQPARLAVVQNADRRHNKALAVFDVSLKKTKYKTEILVQQVVSFGLPQVSGSQILMQARSSECMVLAAGQRLSVYSLKGALLAEFTDHTQSISSICVDSFRVVTASRDLSLRVLIWKNGRDGGLTLEGRYHLLGGSHTMSRGFTHVACDYSSIVASVEGNDGKDVLKAYSFSS